MSENKKEMFDTIIDEDGNIDLEKVIKVIDGIFLFTTQKAQLGKIKNLEGKNKSFMTLLSMLYNSYYLEDDTIDKLIPIMFNAIYKKDFNDLKDKINHDIDEIKKEKSDKTVH